MKDVLDIGCGDGSWAEEQGLTDEGYVGIDIDPDVVEKARKKGLTVKQMDAVKKVPESEFDEIYIRDVLEHVTNPVAVMENAQKQISYLGTVHIQVPSEWSENLWKDYTHRRAFDKEAIHDLADETGLQVQFIEELKTGDRYMVKKLLRLLTGYRLDVNEYLAVLSKKGDM